VLTSLKPDDPTTSRRRSNTFKTCTVKFTGSNSPANLMSRAIRYLFEDEVDTWPDDNDNEAPSLDIVEACTLSYAHAQEDPAHLNADHPDRRHLAILPPWVTAQIHVPCPHCDTGLSCCLST
jgi:phage terminase large subunit GpA-like protein